VTRRHPQEHHYPRVTPEPTEYSDTRDPDLPWGHWMQLLENGREGVRDEHGREWPSLRLALWSGRLGMSDPTETKVAYSAFNTNWRWLDAQMEELQAYLAMAGRQGWQRREDVASLTGASDHYRLWLRGNNLTTPDVWNGPAGHYVRLNEDRLTDEGWAVFLMLKATRPEELHGVLPGSDAFETAGGDAMAEIANPVVNVAGVRFLFERGKLARQPVISLLDRKAKAGRMPIARTIWSMAFDTVLDRDRMFAWMCQRSDLWQRWGGIAGGEADRLTQQLLAAYISSVDWREPQRDPLRLTHEPSPACVTT
jgi:hypothetical protein